MFFLNELTSPMFWRQWAEQTQTMDYYAETCHHKEISALKIVKYLLLCILILLLLGLTTLVSHMLLALSPGAQAWEDSTESKWVTMSCHTSRKFKLLHFVLSFLKFWSFRRTLLHVPVGRLLCRLSHHFNRLDCHSQGELLLSPRLGTDQYYPLNCQPLHRFFQMVYNIPSAVCISLHPCLHNVSLRKDEARYSPKEAKREAGHLAITAVRWRVCGRR